MTQDQIAKVKAADMLLIEEGHPLNQQAVASQVHGVVHIALHYQKGVLSHAKSYLEKTRQVPKV